MNWWRAWRIMCCGFPGAVDALAGHHRHSAATAGLSHRHPPRPGCGSAAQPGQERDGGIGRLQPTARCPRGAGRHPQLRPGRLTVPLRSHRAVTAVGLRHPSGRLQASRPMARIWPQLGSGQLSTAGPAELPCGLGCCYSITEAIEREDWTMTGIESTPTSFFEEDGVENVKISVGTRPACLGLDQRQQSDGRHGRRLRNLGRKLRQRRTPVRHPGAPGASRSPQAELMELDQLGFVNRHRTPDLSAGGATSSWNSRSAPGCCAAPRPRTAGNPPRSTRCWSA